MAKRLDGSFTRRRAYPVEACRRRRNLVGEVVGHAANGIRGAIDPLFRAFGRCDGIVVCHER
jgi:hypothetical protein